MNTITINGVTHDVSGNNIRVTNGKILVDGKIIVEGLSGDVHVKFEGDLANLDATSVSVNGNIMGNVDATSVTVNGDIRGDVDGTSVSAYKINGRVDALSVKIKS